MKGRRCVHFNGVQNRQCSAGVEYVTVERERLPYRRGLPCFAEHENAGNCDRYREQTDDEIAADESVIEQFYEWAKSARASIDAQISRGEFRPGQVSPGVTRCPACGGSLRFVVAVSNGHAAGACDAGGCDFSFRE